jgi:hypothetical protein
MPTPIRRDVALAVEAEHPSVGIDHGDRVEMRRAGAPEERHRQHDAHLARRAAKHATRGTALEGQGPGEVARMLGLAEVGAVEQFLQKDHLRTFGRRLPHQRLGPVGVRAVVVAAGELRDGERALTHRGTPPAR